MNPKPHIGIAKFEKELEKRVHPRFLLNLPVEYYPIDSPGAAQGHTLNASQGGLMVCLKELFQKGAAHQPQDLFLLRSKPLHHRDQSRSDVGGSEIGRRWELPLRSPVFRNLRRKPGQAENLFLDGLSPNLMA